MLEEDEAGTREVETNEEVASNVVVHNSGDAEDLPEPVITLDIWAEEASPADGQLLLRTRLCGYTWCSS